MTAPTDNTSELSDILETLTSKVLNAAMFAYMTGDDTDSRKMFTEATGQAIAALQVYISKKVAAELVRENQKMINTIKKIKGDTDGVSWDGLTRALRHRILELEFAQLTEGSKDKEDK